MKIDSLSLKDTKSTVLFKMSGRERAEGLHVRDSVLFDEIVEPFVRNLFHHGVRLEPGTEVIEVDVVHALILINARKNKLFLPRRFVEMSLQALGADRLHHALHR